MRVARADRVLAVINADDFGISPRVSQDIATCFEAGRISSTTIMSNLPGFESACALARKHGFADRLGVHLNLTLGAPLSMEMQEFCGGQGMGTPVCRLTASREIRNAVEAEIRAQLQRVVREGIRPTHIDSHEHIINGVPYTRIAIRVAREFGIRRMRLTRNACYRRTPLKTMSKALYNSYIRFAGMRTVRYFTDVKPYFRRVSSGANPLPGLIELMCHPGARLSGPWPFATETQLLLSEEFGEFSRSLQLISYGQV